MRWLKITGIVVGVLFIIYSSFWYFHAKANKRQMQAWVDTFAENPMVESFEYEKISMGGFPFSIKVKIQKPKVVLHSGKIVDMIWAYGMTKPKPDYNGMVEMYTDGAFVVKTNIAGSYYKAMVDGDLHTVHLDEKAPFHYRQVADKSYMKLKLNMMETLFNYPTLEDIAQADMENFDFVEAFREIKIYGKNIEVFDNDSNNLMYGFDEMDYSANYDQVKEGMIEAGLNLNLVGSKVSEEYANAWTEIMKVYGVPYNKEVFQAYNNANINLNFNYAGPEIKALEKDPDGPINVDFNLAFKNDLYEYGNQGKINLLFEKGSFKDIDIDITGDALFQPESHQFLVNLYQGTLSDLEQTLVEEGNVAEGDSMFAFMKEHLDELVPKVHELGKMNGAFKLHAESSSGMFFKFDLSDLSFINELYGLALKAKIAGSPLGQIDGDIHIKLSDFDVLFDRINQYMLLLNAFYEDQNMPKPPHLDKDLTDKVKRFLRTFAEEEDEQSKDVTINIKFTHKAPFFTIGGMDQEEVMAKYNEIFAAQESEEVSTDEATDDEAAEDESADNAAETADEATSDEEAVTDDSATEEAAADEAISEDQASEDGQATSEDAMATEDENVSDEAVADEQADQAEPADDAQPTEQASETEEAEEIEEAPVEAE